MRRIIFTAAAALTLAASPAGAHELWFHLDGADPRLARLTFGDTPAPGEAERVAEIAHTSVWTGGKLLDVVRLPDGLEAKLPDPRPALLTAYADRGVIDYQGRTFVIQLAAYAQTRAVETSETTELGLGDEQVRLLLVSRKGGPPVVRAIWKGRPAADTVVKIFHEAEAPREARTDARGEIPCPDLMDGPWTLYVQVIDETPGVRDGRDYSETRYKATLNISPEAAFGPAVALCLARVKETHGATGPWAVAGYRIGERALKELNLPRHSFALRVVHHAPAEVQYSCIADGVQAATGASPGKLNLRLETTTADGLKTVVRDSKSGRTLSFTLNPEFARSISDLPHERLEAEGRRVASLPDDVIFTIAEDR